MARTGSARSGWSSPRRHRQARRQGDVQAAGGAAVALRDRPGDRDLLGIVTLAILPFGNVQDGIGLWIDVSIGVLYFFAFSSISFYGLLLAGWSSGSKYSFLGAMRSAAQLISYEVSMGLALLGAVMITGSLSLTSIVDGQGSIWNIVPQIIGFLIFMVAASPRRTARPSTCPRPTLSWCRAT